MSVPPSRAQSEVFSASQYGGVQPPPKKLVNINYFIIPIFVLEIIGLACFWALFYYLRYGTVPHCKRKCDSVSFSSVLPLYFLIIIESFIAETTL